MLPIIAALTPILGSVIDKVIPDKEAAQKAKDDLAEMEANGELETIKGQLAINLQEAKSENWFVSGWRPFVGWTCGGALFWEYVLKPFVIFWSVLFDWMTKAQIEMLPVMALDVMMPVLLGMLGLGGMRSFEKWKGANKNR